MVVFYFTKMIKIKLKDNFTYKKLKENFVLLNNETGKYLMLNETSIKILEILKKHNDLQKITFQFATYFEIEIQQAESDLRLFLKKAEDLKILEVKYVS